MPGRKDPGVSEIQLSGVSRSFLHGVPVVDAFTLDVPEGERLVVLGPSGSGKSTLLRLIAGLETPDQGSIRIGGRDQAGVPPHRRDLAMVFQNPALYPHLSVFDNLAFGLRARRVPRREYRGRVAQIAEMLRLQKLLERRPHQLSGGERQRVALGGRSSGNRACSCSTSRSRTWTNPSAPRSGRI